ncbi:hypothetical protein [Streptomyces althioticus]|uniref:hypothetical protein n=1 Tax=Streptomyces althioticus TaxID=83380 RepID=UPI00378E694A
MDDQQPTELIELPGDRRVQVIAYPDGSIEFRVSGLPYVLAEARLGDPDAREAIVKLSPGRQGSAAAYNYVEELEKWARGQAAPARRTTPH